jgi:hypothetical protein
MGFGRLVNLAWKDRLNARKKTNDDGVAHDGEVRINILLRLFFCLNLILMKKAGTY